MKLLLVNYEYPPLGGGAGNATACLAQALHRLGHAAHVVTASYRGLPASTVDRGVVLHRIGSLRRRVDRANLIEMLSFVLHASLVVPRMARRLGFDGCIVFFSLPCGPIGWLAKAVSGLPYVVALRGGDVPGTEPGIERLQQLLTPLRRAVLTGARAVIANSFGLAAFSRAADPHPVDVIPNGVDTSFFMPPASRPGHVGQAVHFLFAGRFQAQKNLFVLLRQFAAASALASRPIRLTLVGDGPLRAALHAETATLGIADKVAWRGWMGKAELARLYREADVFLNPSLYEGMPNTVLEAMASGLPVIASAVAGNDELVEDQDTGILFDLDSPESLSEAILRLAEDGEFRLRCGRAARTRAVDGYSWDVAAMRYAAYFSEGKH